MYSVKYTYPCDYVYSTQYYWHDIISECAVRCQTDKSLKPSGHAEKRTPRRDYTTVNIFQPFEKRSCNFYFYFLSKRRTAAVGWTHAHTHTHAQCSLKQVVEIIDEIRRRRFTATSVYCSPCCWLLLNANARPLFEWKKKKKHVW